jgi:lipoyltransferase and lipoate-protein ligase
MVYVESYSTSPYFNFALEQYLMKEKDLEDKEIFMFWRTNPTVMIGRYQNTIEEINTKYVEENGVNVVRRVSGGGTIYTDMNGWQYSFIIKDYKANSIDFKVFTLPIISALQKHGVNAYFNSRNDLLISGKKFSGNAQYIKGNRILHHGSILFNTDIKAMVESISVADEKIISKGIKSVRERVTNVAEHLKKNVDSVGFKNIMIESLLKGTNNVYKLNEYDIRRIDEIAKEKFESWEWTYGNSPKFNITKWGRFSGGKVEFKLYVEKGIIKSCNIYGDFFGIGEINMISKALRGCRYEKKSIENILKEIEVEKYFYKISKDQILGCIISSC